MRTAAMTANGALTSTVRVMQLIAGPQRGPAAKWGYALFVFMIHLDAERNQ
jgi:hypothetical protein